MISGPELYEAARLVGGVPPRGLVVLTGAGISTDAGIPDFRGPSGVWTKNPGAERLSTLDAYLSDPELRRRAWRNRLASPVWSARPTAGHLAVYELARRGLVRAVITQNTDGLHGAAGHAEAQVIEVHGNVHFTECWSCKEIRPMDEALARVRAGEEDLICLRERSDGLGPCGGILKSATVSFGQSLDRATLERATEVVCGCAVLLAVGTTLEVQPVASLVPLAARTGASIVIVNGSPTALDQLADVIVRGPISEILPALVPLDPISGSE
jgi:NAD-dependent deacetylase